MIWGKIEQNCKIHIFATTVYLLLFIIYSLYYLFIIHLLFQTSSKLMAVIFLTISFLLLRLRLLNAQHLWWFAVSSLICSRLPLSPQGFPCPTIPWLRLLFRKMLSMQQKNFRWLSRYVRVFNELLRGEELSIGLKCSWDFTDDLLLSERNEKRKLVKQGHSHKKNYDWGDTHE